MLSRYQRLSVALFGGAAGGAQDVVHFAYVAACRPDLALCLRLGSPEDAAFAVFLERV